MAWPRTRKPQPLLLLGVAVVAATAGCRSGGGEAPRAQATTTVAVTSTTVGVASTAAAGGTTVTTLAPGAAPLSLSARHPAGVTLKLTSIAVAEDSISVGVVVTNGGSADVKLNEFDDLVLIDDHGGRYLVSPPPQDSAITVRKSTTLRGSLVFTGQLDRAATSLTLVTNEKGGGDNQYSTRPKIVVDGIPVHGG
jgi:hypothetical protein